MYCLSETVTSSDSGSGLYVSTDAFDNSNLENITLHVPAGSIEAYCALEPWKSFKHIEAPYANFSVSAHSYSTFYSNKPVTLLSADNFKLYTITNVSGKALTLSEPFNTVPAYTPVLIYNEADVESEASLIEASDITVDAFSYDTEHFFGTVEDKTFSDADMQNADHYVLSKSNNFVWVKDAGTLEAGNCWIEIAKSSANARTLSIGGGEGTSGIQSIGQSDYLQSDTWYDLNGRKLSGNPTKEGVYVKDGQKVVIK